MELIQFTDERWKSHLRDNQASPYLSPAYNQIMAKHQQGESCLLLSSEQQNSIASSLLICKNPLAYDAITPYGYCGFSQALTQLTLTKLSAFLRENAIIAAYFLLHPLCNTDELAAFGEHYQLSHAHHAYLINLKQPLDSIINAWSNHHKRHLRKLLQKNMTPIFDKDQLTELFIAYYKKNCHEKSMSSVYHFSEQTLRELLSLKEAKLIGFFDGQDICAISCFLVNNYQAEYFLNASSREGRNYSRLIFFNAVKLFKEHGCQWLNLGGGIKDNDKLSWFKSQLGTIPISVKQLKLVLDQDKYRKLCSQAKTAANFDNYFPSYRKVSQ